MQLPGFKRDETTPKSAQLSSNVARTFERGEKDAFLLMLLMLMRGLEFIQCESL